MSLDIVFEPFRYLLFFNIIKFILKKKKRHLLHEKYGEDIALEMVAARS